MKKVILILLVGIVSLVDARIVEENVFLKQVYVPQSPKTLAYQTYIDKKRYNCVPIPEEGDLICVHNVPETNIFSLLRAKKNNNGSYDIYEDIEHKIVTGKYKKGQTKVIPD